MTVSLDFFFFGVCFNFNFNKYIDRFERKLDLDFWKGNQENKYAMMIATV